MTAIIIQLPGLKSSLSKITNSNPESNKNTAGVMGRRQQRETQSSAMEADVNEEDEDTGGRGNFADVFEYEPHPRHEGFGQDNNGDDNDDQGQ